MSIKISKRRIILISLIAVFAVEFILQKSISGRSKIKQLSVSEEITKIEADGILIEKNGSSWTVGEKKYKADTDAVLSVVNSVKDLKLLGTVTSLSESNRKRYGFDEGTAVTVKAYSGENLVRTVTAGKNTSTNSQSYITVDEKNTVYLASGALNSVLRVTLDAMRSKEIYSEDASQIVYVEVSNKEGKYSLSKNISSAESGVVGQPYWSVLENTTKFSSDIDEEKISSFINSISSLKCSQWQEDVFKFDYADFDDLILRTPVASYELKFVQDGEDFIVSSNTTPYAFKVKDYVGKRFVKSLSDLIK